MYFLETKQLITSITNSIKSYSSLLSISLRTNIYVCYQPPTIACAVIYLAARICGVKLPTQPPWWELFEAELEDIL